MGRLAVLAPTLLLLLAACGGSGGDEAPLGDAADAADGAPDTTPDLAPDPGPIEDPCEPDPCVLRHRQCVDGDCQGCVEGYVEEDGTCVPAGDPCDPNPCESVHKECVGGFCGGCLPGFLDDGEGGCLEQTPCFPNPCVEPRRTTCKVGDDGEAVCQCAPGAHDDGAGGCTYDPCVPDPCEAPFTRCTPEGTEFACGCPEGEMPSEAGDACVDDPCAPNPCTDYARTVCTLDEAGAAVCGCDPGFVDEDGACVEAAITNAETLTAPEGDVVVDHARQLFADDWLIAQRSHLARNVHKAVRVDDEWIVGPDPDADIGRARAHGSLVHLDAEELEALPEGDPLKPYPWRLYYMGYRQLWSPGPEPAWLCVAVTDAPGDPEAWVKPELDPEAPAPHCILRAEGLEVAQVSRVDGQWLLSATRRAVGDVAAAGMYLYGSEDGVAWTPLADGEPIMTLADAPTPPAAYARIGTRSRLAWDPWAERWEAFLALPSDDLGDARGVMLGGEDPTTGWGGFQDPVAAPSVLGPTPTELASGTIYGDMAAWRVGGLWMALVQKRRSTCPKRDDASLAVSRDGRHWAMVRDEIAPDEDAVLAHATSDGEPDSSIATLSGGAPAEADGLWHFLSGGLEADPCGAAEPPAGGIVRHMVRAGGLVGLTAQGGTTPAKLTTRPMVMAPGLSGSVLHLEAFVGTQLLVTVETLSPVDTVLTAEEKLLGPGDYRDAALDMPPLNDLTDGRFRIRFTFVGEADQGELFGFRLGDPACTPDPCAGEEEKTRCDSGSGEAVCVCAPPLHGDGEGGCTDDPCVPDPCTGPHQEGCEGVDGQAVCGCEEGWVPQGAGCIPDPCVVEEGEEPICQPPGPDLCRSVNGEAECYCPEGSEPGPSGCRSVGSRAFVTSLSVAGGEIGGRAGADEVCAGLASGAEMPGEYAAWLSTSEVDAASRFVGGGPWRTWDPETQLWTRLVAEDVADLTDGALATPIDRTEFGADAGGDCRAWTGTLADGTADVPEGDAAPPTCGGWSSGDASGRTGRCDAADATWTEDEERPCDQALRLYCLQVPADGVE
ncbi:MAG: hypothetical protein ACQEXJ_22250 [Myxococcota bacterium]